MFITRYALLISWTVRCCVQGSLISVHGQMFLDFLYYTPSFWVNVPRFCMYETDLLGVQTFYLPGRTPINLDWELQTCYGHSGLSLYVFLLILLSSHYVCLWQKCNFDKNVHHMPKWRWPLPVYWIHNFLMIFHTQPARSLGGLSRLHSIKT